MKKIVIKDGIKWEYDTDKVKYTYIEKVEDEKPKKTKKGEE